MDLRRCLAVAGVLGLLPLGAQGLGARLEQAERVVAAHYRGEALEAQRARVAARVEAFNAQAKARRGEMDASRAKLEALLAPLKRDAATLQELDARIARPPKNPDPAQIDAFNALVKRRNAFAADYNARSRAAQQEVDAFNARRAAVDAGLEGARKEVQAARAGLDVRLEASAAFLKGGGDLAFFRDLNRLLGACRQSGDAASLAKVRALRRELAAWAMAQASAQPDGPILVQATLEGEPCCLMLDTGAQKPTLGPELAEALGLGAGEEADLVLAGGVRLRGRHVELKELTVAGVTARQVPALLVPASEVGVDGLLGLSFLRRFRLSLGPEGLHLREP